MIRYASGNRLTLLKNGEEYFPALLAAIDAAKDEIFLETYIYADDQTGSLVSDALARAAARGVRVHLLLDGFGARDFAPRFAEALKSAGAGILIFRPDVTQWSLRRGRLRRMHRKLACIDAQIAFVGGINVIDDFDGRDLSAPRLDYAVRIVGPLAADVRLAAARLWALVAWARSRRRFPGLAALRGRANAPAAALPQPGGQRAALLVRDSLRHRSDIEDAYLHYIGSARHEILIASAYFFPGRRFHRALIAAARRGVRVRLLLQGKVEYFLAHYAGRALYGALLESGIEIYEYHSSYLHAKVAVFDRAVACVGSSNIDPLSLLLAREANVFVDDEAFAAELQASLEKAMRLGASHLPQRQWHRQPFFLRVRTRMGYAIARWLMALFGFERYH